jgi:hypothetical protein
MFSENDQALLKHLWQKLSQAVADQESLLDYVAGVLN